MELQGRVVGGQERRCGDERPPPGWRSAGEHTRANELWLGVSQREHRHATTKWRVACRVSVRTGGFPALVGLDSRMLRRRTCDRRPMVRARTVSCGARRRRPRRKRAADKQKRAAGKRGQRVAEWNRRDSNSRPLAFHAGRSGFRVSACEADARRSCGRLRRALHRHRGAIGDGRSSLPAPPAASTPGRSAAVAGRSGSVAALPFFAAPASMRRHGASPASSKLATVSDRISPARSPFCAARRSSAERSGPVMPDASPPSGAAARNGVPRNSKVGAEGFSSDNGREQVRGGWSDRSGQQCGCPDRGGSRGSVKSC